MLNHKLLSQKIFTLCQFISQGIDSRKTNQLIMKACQLGLPLSPNFTKERYIYNIALAAITTIVEITEGFQLAAIFLKDVCVGKSYWDILHFLYQFKEEMVRELTGGDYVIQRIQVFNIAICHDLNTIYRCHCSLRNISHCFIASNKKVPKILPVALSIPKLTLHLDSNKNGRNKKEVVEIEDLDIDSVTLIENQNKIQNFEINKYQCVKDYIYLDADFVDLSQSQFDGIEESSGSVFQIEDKILEHQLIVQKTVVKIDSAQATSSNKFNCLLNQKPRQVDFNAIVVGESDQSYDEDNQQSSSVSLISENPSEKSKDRDDSDVEPINMSQYYEFLQQKHEKRQQKAPQKIPQIQNHRLERCEICLQLYHPLCQTDQIFICNKCYLKQNSIKYRVINSLFSGYVHGSSYLTSVNFQCPNVATAKAQYSETFIVELRFQYFQPPKSDQQNLFDRIKNMEQAGRRKQKKNKMTKDNVFFYLNYQPLPIKNVVANNFQIHSAKIPLKYLQEKNTLVIQKFKVQPTKKSNSLTPQQQKIMLLGIYQVVPRSRRKQPINNSITRLSERASSLFYQSVLRRNRETYMKISNLSGVSNMTMTCPIRSYQCSHPTCFDFSEINLNDNNTNPRRRMMVRKTMGPKDQKRALGCQNFLPSPRVKRSQKMVCPICGVEMKGLYLDKLMLRSIEEQKEKKKGNFLEIFNQQIQLQSSISKESLIMSNKQRNSSLSKSLIEIIQQSEGNQIFRNPKPTIQFSDSELQVESIQGEDKMMKKTTAAQKKQSSSSLSNIELEQCVKAMMELPEDHIQYIQDSLEIVENSGSIQDFFILVESIENTQSL